MGFVRKVTVVGERIERLCILGCFAYAHHSSLVPLPALCSVM
ncbi:hypothetical protein SLEP1_g56556 [Rubroshorea leprosula]|uniref:Uncharacterized protein n=1 Tax=Rubroshorea leprosula TaxID=152421 RepID=A0AAV5MIU7_9ROSI|nr:hypothetical protein SLEP1_g56556 [Rubroshorea leprosula]